MIRIITTTIRCSSSACSALVALPSFLSNAEQCQCRKESCRFTCQTPHLDVAAAEWLLSHRAIVWQHASSDAEEDEASASTKSKMPNAKKKSFVRCNTRHVKMRIFNVNNRMSYKNARSRKLVVERRSGTTMMKNDAITCMV